MKKQCKSVKSVTGTEICHENSELHTHLVKKDIVRHFSVKPYKKILFFRILNELHSSDHDISNINSDNVLLVTRFISQKV